VSKEKETFIQEFVVKFIRDMGLEGECDGIDYNEDILRFVMADESIEFVITLLTIDRPEDASLILDEIISNHIYDAALKYAEFAWGILNTKI
jgi:hypothetical protein